MVDANDIFYFFFHRFRLILIVCQLNKMRASTMKIKLMDLAEDISEDIKEEYYEKLVPVYDHKNGYG